MTPDLVRRTAVVFLDQFIRRGAAPDIRDVRGRLADDEMTGQTLLDELPTGDPDERQAFDAFRRFLANELEAHPSQDISEGPNLTLLLSWTEWDWGDGQTTSDPAQWHDWLGAAKIAADAA
jgi:hypothetical protein